MDTRVRDILVALGDGGTVGMAERVVEHLGISPMWNRGMPLECLAGLSEVAAHLGRPRQVVRNWMTRGKLSCPEPVKTLAATPLWDLEQWKVWAIGHPDIVEWVDSPMESLVRTAVLEAGEL